MSRRTGRAGSVFRKERYLDDDPDGASSTDCSTRQGLPPRKATAAHGAALWGNAQLTLPALDVAAPAIFWAKEEIAIDALHRTVYALATGITYPLLSSSRTNN